MLFRSPILLQHLDHVRGVVEDVAGVDRADVEAGQVLGTLVGVALLHNAKFRDDYEAAAIELKMAGLTQ